MKVVVKSDAVAHAAHGDDVLARQPQQVSAAVVAEVGQQRAEAISAEPLHHLGWRTEHFW